jgi:hypothetical protein
MSARTTLDFGLGVLHLDVLRARLKRRRRQIRALLLLLALAIILALAQPLLTWLILGRGTLVLAGAPADAALALDGQPLDASTFVALSGEHTLSVQRPGFYGAMLPLQITRDQTTTMTLPALRPRPAVQPVPLPGVGARWQAAAPDGAGGWRLVAAMADVRPTPMPAGSADTDTAPAPTLLRLDGLGLTRLAALEAYAAADERTTAAGTSWAAYEIASQARGGWLAAGRLTIRWPGGSTVLTPTAPISGLWWAPDGWRLLIAIQQGSGQDLLLWSPGVTMLEAPIVTVPGQIVVVQWQEHSRAAVVLSTAQPSRAAPGRETAPSWDATLLLVPTSATEHARSLRLAPPPRAPLGLVPLAWQDDALLWVTASEPAWELQRVPFGTALPVRLGPVPMGTLALHINGDGALRLLVQDGRALTLRDHISDTTLLAIDDVPQSRGMSGAWQGGTLLLATEQELWALTFSPAALR